MKHGLKGVTDATVFCKSMQKGGSKPMIRSMKSYAEGGMTSTDSECSGWPPGKKGGCRKVTKFKSKGKSSSKSGPGVIGKVAGALGLIAAGYGINKYAKNNKNNNN